MPAQSLRIGFALNFRTSSRDIEDVARVYEEVLETIAYADELGIDSVWVGQHHFDNTDGPFASPLPFLVAAANRTSRITLGTGITTVPFEDPLRLAEDAAVVDALTGGRVHLGLGTGGANLDGFAAFGLRSEQRHALFAQKVAKLHAALDGKSLVDGADGPHLYPPGSRVRRQLWQAATSIASATAAGAASDGLQQGAFFDPADTGQAPKVEAYLEALERSHPGATPRVAVFRFVYSGRDKETVLRQVEPVLGPRLPALAERAATGGNLKLRGLSVREYLDLVPFYGSPDDIAERVATDPAITAGATDFVANFSYRDEFDAASARARVHSLATEIGPAIGWRPGAVHW
ncbi:LLM class flavin-dependent oxidoreductase [Amycolatopsis panacis]|uniref:LLM class flavin-dependent oxidoreductase n=1 Tax=Amycolatopsis panacis TaxID=2340917 RepID=A0A419I297_9PSEU|nr:LLM class flavin-dependent oxidoreductase [Amycolatopsis panacis]RJQ83974.1 LLM class flavin-dependent oxidoreductase [Amycolatopsis panacis]